MHKKRRHQPPYMVNPGREVEDSNEQVGCLSFLHGYCLVVSVVPDWLEVLPLSALEAPVESDEPALALLSVLLPLSLDVEDPVDEELELSDEPEVASDPPVESELPVAASGED